METLADRTSRILDKIRLINQRRRREDRPAYVLDRPLSERKIRAFEIKYGVSLPAEYRFFLANAGNGNREPWGWQIFALESRDQMAWHLSRAPSLTLRGKFIFSTAQGRSFMRRVAPGLVAAGPFASKVWEKLHEHPRLNVLRGSLVLNYTGSGQDLTALIVRGEERGKIWIVNEYFYPVFRRHRSRFVTFTFLEWVELLLDEEIEAPSRRRSRAGFETAATGPALPSR